MSQPSNSLSTLQVQQKLEENHLLLTQILAAQQPGVKLDPALQGQVDRCACCWWRGQLPAAHRLASLMLLPLPVCRCAAPAAPRLRPWPVRSWSAKLQHNLMELAGQADKAAEGR